VDEEAAFLVSIEAAPDDNTLRLVYADWLDERGRPEGAFIRIECELAIVEHARKQDELLDAQLRTDQCDVQLVLEYDLSQRCSLVARLLSASRRLDPKWIARVCRLPEEELYARDRAIQFWRRRQVTVAEMLARMAAWDKPPALPKSFGRKVRGLFKRSAGVEEPHADGPHACVMREWVEANMQPGDELWEYFNVGESWALLRGEMGYAIVRDGKVVEFTMLPTS
jgi:uncharacterized protein (TIGR02996 family)